MSADTLRRAAAVLRERAEGVITGDGPTRSTEWVYDETWTEGRYEVVAVDEGTVIAASLYRPDAAYIATMHPGVGLALADWLDEVHAWIEEGVGLIPDGNIGDAWIGAVSHGKAVARLILGEAS